jgi:aldose 1-epimerase
LKRGAGRVLIAPQHGARILRWEHDGREVIHWPEDADWTRILKVRGGNPILFPFVARHFVEGRQNFWRDADGTVRPMAQHGFARDALFALVDDEADENSVRMRLTDSAATRPEYPFAFSFDVAVHLQEEGRLEIRFETKNLGERPLPYYAGHHFYFALPHAERGHWQLDLPCAQWGRQDASGSILHEKPTATQFSLADPALIDRFQIHPDPAKITLRDDHAGRSIELELNDVSSIPWYAVTTWTESPESDFYCVEPWLGLPNAISHGEGLRRVAPGEMETATCIIKATGISA